MVYKKMYWVNGVPKKMISINNRAVHFGDGFFTTARLNDGKIDFFNLHINRLILSAKKLMFNNFDIDIVYKEMQKAAIFGINGFIKVIISRINRDGKMYGYRCSDAIEVSRIIYTGQLPHYYSEWLYSGIKMKTSVIRLARNCFLAGIKHLNRLEQVMIAHWIQKDRTIDEALVLDTEGNIVECCSANIFWRKNNRVFTPSVCYAGVNGIIRQLVLKLISTLGYLSEEVIVNVESLKEADEVFITNSLLPIVSVNVIDDVFYKEKKLCDLLNLYLFK